MPIRKGHKNSRLFNFFFGTILVTFSVSSICSADTASKSLGYDDFEQELDWLAEETLVISASRVALNITKTPVSISVIDQDEIRSMGARDLLDVLKTVPGIGITRSQIWVNEVESRGVKTPFSEKILFMLDGHSLDSNLVNGGGTLIFDRIHLDNVKRIEIVRGPASAIYGANAFVALIHIITKDANDIDGLDLYANGGSYASKDGTLLYGKQFEDLKVFASLNLRKSDGFDAHVTNDAENKNGYADQWKQWQDFDLKLNYKDWYFRGKYLQHKDGPNFGITYTLNNDTKTKQRNWFGEIGYKSILSDEMELESRLYHDFYTFENYWAMSSLLLDAAAKNKKTGAETLIRYQFNPSNLLIAGMLLENQKQYDIKNRTNYDPGTFVPHPDGEMIDYSDSKNWGVDYNRKLWALYVEDLYDYNERIHIALGARYDHYDDFGGIINPKFGVAYELNDATTLKFNYGQGFRAPTFAEVSNTVYNDLIIGNPDLKAEKVKTYEWGINIKAGQATIIGLTLFNNEVTDQIRSIGNTYDNLGTMKSKGLEAEIKHTMKRGSYLAANYTYQEAQGNDGMDIADIATHKANIFANLRISTHFNLYTNLFLKSSTPRAIGDTRANNSGYGLLNTTLLINNFGASLKSLEFSLSIKNLLDKQYYDPSPQGKAIVEGYEGEGRNFMAKLTYHFN